MYKSSQVPIEITSIHPGDRPRAETWKRMMSQEKDLSIFNQGPLEPNQILDVSDYDIKLMIIKKPDGNVTFADNSNHRLAYLFWRYGDELKIANYNVFIVSELAGARILEILDDPTIPGSFKEYVRLAEEKRNSESRKEIEI